MKRPCSPALRFGSAAFVLVMATSFGVAGCGAAPSPNAGFGDSKVASAQMPPEPTPHNINEAESQLLAAEQHVFGVLGQDKQVAQGRFATPPQQAQPAPSPTMAAESSPPPPPGGDAARTFKDGDAKPADAPMAGAAATGASSSPCETACRALASMNRAATHICMLAGDDSESCLNARERVRVATERVRQSCTECSSG